MDLYARGSDLAVRPDIRPLVTFSVLTRRDPHASTRVLFRDAIRPPRPVRLPAAGKVLR